MQDTENQRFTEVINYLRNNGAIKFEKDISDELGTNKDRIKYLKKENGGSISNEELQILKKSFPQINWVWVKLGEGSMLAGYDKKPSPSFVLDSEMIYEKNPEHQELLNKILSNNSTLPEPEQKRILINEVISLQQKIIDIYESTPDPLNLIKELKKLLK